jgi:XapX domain-containing protein
VIKQSIGLAFAFSLGFVCKKLNIPSAAPMTFFGCLIVLMMTLGFKLG